MADLFCPGLQKQVAQPGEDAPPEIHPENEERENNLQSDAPDHSSESDSPSVGREDVGQRDHNCETKDAG